MRAPRSAPFAGRRKAEVAMAPVAVRGPLSTELSVLARAGTADRFHELPLPVERPSATAVPLRTDRFAVSRDAPESTSKPVFGLAYAVSWSRVIDPGLPLSVNPCAMLLKAMLLR